MDIKKELDEVQKKIDEIKKSQETLKKIADLQENGNGFGQRHKKT